MVTAQFRLGAVIALAGVAGCEIDRTTIPRPDPSLVVHAVLNPSTRTQYVLVEQSLTGSQTIIDNGPYDPNHPITSGNGVPVSGAIVTITGPNGVVMIGVEDRPSGAQSGVYRVDLDTYNANIQPGGRYALAVRALGQLVVGETVVPLATRSGSPPRVSLNRDIDSVHVSVAESAAARAFWIQIDAPLGTYHLFTLEKKVDISGLTRNIFSDELTRVFQPGFLQTMTVAAIDTNLYDYYRSGNDPFSGKGLINHLDGGLGVFGSVVVVDQRVFDVTQNATGDSIEGHYTLRNGSPGVSDRAFDLQLFLAAPGGTDNPDAISGSHLRGLAQSPVRGGVLGTRSGNTLRLELLSGQSASRIQSIFQGTIKGDSLRGSIEGFGPPVLYVRAGK